MKKIPYVLFVFILCTPVHPAYKRIQRHSSTQKSNKDPNLELFATISSELLINILSCIKHPKDTYDTATYLRLTSKAFANKLKETKFKKMLRPLRVKAYPLTYLLLTLYVKHTDKNEESYIATNPKSFAAILPNPKNSFSQVLSISKQKTSQWTLFKRKSKHINLEFQHLTFWSRVPAKNVTTLEDRLNFLMFNTQKPVVNMKLKNFEQRITLSTHRGIGILQIGSNILRVTVTLKTTNAELDWIKKNLTEIEEIIKKENGF